LLSRNEVGANPAVFSMSAEAFHEECVARVQRFPQAMLATATHDHKRGEDLRARLTVISEDVAAWREVVEAWRQRNASLRRSIDSAYGPDNTDEYMLYQMIVAAWPLTLMPDDASGLESLRDRLGAWQLKAIREAKRRTGWAEPNLEYEEACKAFLETLLDPVQSADFLREASAYANRLAPAGAVNGLSQTLIKLTAPGVPDFYQGTEFWDYSLVDPDNRRPVDYAARSTALDAAASTDQLLQPWRNGHIKQRLISRALALRAAEPALFLRGEYLPLAVSGPGAGHLLAYARVSARAAAIVVVPLFATSLLGDSARPQIDPARWEDTAIHLPESLKAWQWTRVLDDSPSKPDLHGRSLLAAAVLEVLPVALLIGKP
jgi:(1->4)-alpha-D-glucan 1-alpha-D-glucosylmutase